MKVRFWGVRGSIATPGPQTATYGGNTTCIEVEDNDGNIFIFDAGTGIRNLGQDLLARGKNNVSLFITHTHWDHIQGFPFFVPSYVPGNSIKIYGPIHFNKNLQGIMNLQMDYTYFPISMAQLNAKIEYQDLKEETVEIGNTKIITKYSNHPVTGLCYKIVNDGQTVVFSGDTEPYYNVLSHGQTEGKEDTENDSFDDFEDFEEDEDMDKIVEEKNEQHKQFCISDILIHDAQYTAEEYSQFVGWGHSPMEYVIDMAKSSGIKKLVLTHHDPDKNDEKLSDIENKLIELNPDLDLCFAKEGMEIEI